MTLDRIAMRPLIVALAVLFLAGFAAPRASAQVDGAKSLHSGTWTKKTNKIAGTWSIVEKNGKKSVVLDKAFKTSKAPDLKIILSPTESSKLTNKNAMKKAVVISLLKSPKGAQSYHIPKGIDLSKFKTIAIHCERYSKLWGSASLAAPKAP